MAQVKFYSVDSLPAGASNASAEGNIYFVNRQDGQAIYKGSTLFGAPKIYNMSRYGSTATISAATGMIRGDIMIGIGAAKVFDGTNWQDLGSDETATRALISSMISGLAAGDSAETYIAAIEQDEAGNVIAHAKEFPAYDYNPNESVASSTNNGHTVAVTTQSGKVTAVAVTAPPAFTKASIGDGTETSSSNGITVGVTTTSGVVTAVTVTASEIANVMHFRGTTPSLVAASTSTMRVGDIWLITSSTTSYYITPNGWGSTTAAEGNKKLVAGQEYILTSQNGFELIGDQTAWGLSKAQIGSSNSNLKGLKAAIELKANADPTVTLTNDSIVTASTNIANNAANDKLITASAVAAYAMKKGDVTGGNHTSASKGVSVKVTTAATTAAPTVSVTVTPATLFDDLDATVSSTSNGIGVTVVESDGKLTECTVTANTTTFRNGWNATVSSQLNGVKFTVVQSNGLLSTASLTGVGTAASKDFANSLASTGTKLPTESAVWGAIGTRVTGGTSSVYASNLNSAVKLTVGTASVTASVTTLSITGLGTVTSLSYVTSVDATGADTNVPTEKAVRTAITSAITAAVTGGDDYDSDHGIGLAVSITAQTAAPSIDIQVAPAESITASSPYLPTASVVYSYIWNEALVWKNENGAVIS